jgi:hypothetical protein
LFRRSERLRLRNVARLSTGPSESRQQELARQAGRGSNAQRRRTIPRPRSSDSDGFPNEPRREDPVITPTARTPSSRQPALGFHWAAKKGETMNRRVTALVLVLCATSMLAACGSGIQASAPSTQAPASATSPEPRPTPTRTVDASAATTPTLQSPGQRATASPTPFTVPETTYVPGPQPSIALAAAGAPAPPTGTALDYPADQCNSVNPNESCQWLRVTWREGNPSGVTVRVYAVTACLHTPTASKPNVNCIAEGDTIPSESLLILGTAPASAGSLSFVLVPGGEGSEFGSLPEGGPNVQAILLQAVNTHGGSPFAIVASSSSCYGCVL